MSSKEYLSFILEQLSDLNDISYKSMMGEYIIYYKGKIIGGIYDDRFLVKITPTTEKLLFKAERQLPYEGAKEMLLVDNVEEKSFLKQLFISAYDELPMPRRKR